MDVSNITGRGSRTARKLLVRISKEYKIKKGAFVSITQFCSYTGLDENQVRAFLI